MKITLLYLSVCVFHTLASSDTKKEVFIRVTPGRSQFLQYEHVSLSCEVSAGSSRLKRNTNTRGTETCSYGWGSLNGSTCTITAMYPSDTGLYWCESSSGEQSQTVHIKVTAGSVILESPALPVMEGHNVTLRCTNKKPSFKLTADFYKDGALIMSSFTGNMTIHSVSKSDEGLYKCSISEAGESAESRLAVRGVFHTLASSDTETEVFIRVTPGRSQFLQYEHVSLSCEVSAGSSRLKRNTNTRGTETCSYGWGSLNGSTCTITAMYPSDTGLYWCESSSGEQSQTVHIKVTAGSVILESPALPVMEGHNVTLRCTNKKPSFKLTADFYKDGILVMSSFTGNMTIHSASKSDEGLYKCSISEAGESAESRLAVRGPVMSVSRLICHVVVGTPYVLTTIILGLIYRDRRRAPQLVAEDRSHHVIMEVE